MYDSANYHQAKRDQSVGKFSQDAELELRAEAARPTDAAFWRLSKRKTGHVILETRAHWRVEKDGFLGCWRRSVKSRSSWKTELRVQPLPERVLKRQRGELDVCPLP